MLALVRSCLVAGAVAAAATTVAVSTQEPEPVLGSERAITQHLLNGAEFKLPLRGLIDYGKALFTANWTDEDGGGRPLAKGTGEPLVDRSRPLTGTRRFNRISGPDANSCAGCHNAPYGIAGGSGDFVTSVFVRAERFDFVSFDRGDATRTRGSLDESGRPVTLQSVGNLRSTPGLFGAGYLELLAREMTADLQSIRDNLRPGESQALAAKGVSFGLLSRRADGSWDTRRVSGLPPQSLVTGVGTKPSLVIRPWHQSGSTPSLREFIVTAFNRHHGIQATERFGVGTDPDGDGVTNELTRGDVTAVAAYVASLPVPGRVIANDAAVEKQVLAGERMFERIGCTQCHVPSLPLNRATYTEPGPLNQAGTLQPGTGRPLSLSLNDSALTSPRLSPDAAGILRVPAYTDFKLHDITDSAKVDEKEPLDINQPDGSTGFLAGNRRFLTRRLWGAANEPPYFHHGLFTTLREAVVAHSGEALASRQFFERASETEQQALLRFLETLQVLPPGTRHLVVDEHFRPKLWPPRSSPR